MRTQDSGEHVWTERDDRASEEKSEANRGWFIMFRGRNPSSQHSGSVVVAHRLSCANLLRSGIKPVFPALQEVLLTTGPPGKPAPGGLMGLPL